MMKINQFVSILFLIVATFSFVVYYFYSNVDGSELTRLIKSQNAQIIQITKSHILTDDVVDEIILDNTQTERLFLLIEESKFKKNYSGRLPYDDEIHTVIIRNSDNQIYFRLESYGNEFIVINSSPIHWRLEIKNLNWEKVFNEIIS